MGLLLDFAERERERWIREARERLCQQAKDLAAKDRYIDDLEVELKIERKAKTEERNRMLTVLLDEAWDCWPPGSTILREEIIAWLISRVARPQGRKAARPERGPA